MSWSIHHVNLEAKDVRRAAAFYQTILGMTEKPWEYPAQLGYIPGAPDRLALFGDGRQSHTVLHLIKADPDFAEKNRLTHNPSVGANFEQLWQAVLVDRLVDRVRRIERSGHRGIEAVHVFGTT